MFIVFFRGAVYCFVRSCLVFLWRLFSFCMALFSFRAALFCFFSVVLFSFCTVPLSFLLALVSFFSVILLTFSALFLVDLLLGPGGGPTRVLNDCCRAKQRSRRARGGDLRAICAVLSDRPVPDISDSDDR